MALINAWPYVPGVTKTAILTPVRTGGTWQRTKVRGRLHQDTAEEATDTTDRCRMTSGSAQRMCRFDPGNHPLFTSGCIPGELDTDFPFTTRLGSPQSTCARWFMFLFADPGR